MTRAACQLRTTHIGPIRNRIIGIAERKIAVAVDVGAGAVFPVPDGRNSLAVGGDPTEDDLRLRRLIIQMTRRIHGERKNVTFIAGVRPAHPGTGETRRIHVRRVHSDSDGIRRSVVREIERWRPTRHGLRVAAVISMAGIARLGRILVALEAGGPGDSAGVILAVAGLAEPDLIVRLVQQIDVTLLPQAIGMGEGAMAIPAAPCLFTVYFAPVALGAGFRAAAR